MRQSLRHDHAQSVPQQLKSVSLRYHVGSIGSSLDAPARGWAHRWASDPEPGQLVDDRSPSGRDMRIQRLEAVLFLAREPLTSRKLSQFASLADATEARTLIRRLNELYDASRRAFRIEEVAGGYQLLTRSPFAAWLSADWSTFRMKFAFRVQPWRRWP